MMQELMYLAARLIHTGRSDHGFRPLASGKWFGTREFLQQSAETNYGLDKPDLLRSVAAHMGLYGNSAAEAVYPTYLTDADGEPLNASAHRYTISFPKGALPPVKETPDWDLDDLAVARKA